MLVVGEMCWFLACVYFKNMIPLLVLLLYCCYSRKNYTVLYTIAGVRRAGDTGVRS